MTAVRKKAQDADLRSDSELLGLAHGGDREAVGKLFDRYAQMVYGFARRFNSAAEAEDVVQITFMRVAEIAGSYDDRSLSARAWIFGVAYRVMSERRRATRRLAATLKSYAELLRAAPAPDAVHDSVDLDRGLCAISEPKRVVLVLTQVNGFTCDEVARMLDLPIGTVWTRLHHARRELRAYLEGTP